MNVGLVPVTLTSALVSGALLVLVSSLKQPLAQRLEMPAGKVGRLLAALYLVMVPLLPLAGVLIDTFGVQQGLIAGALLAAAGLSFLALIQNPTSSLVTVLLIGGASACLATATTVLIPATLFEGQKAAAMNVGFVAVGLGAVLIPWVLDAVLTQLRWRRGLLLLALLCLLPALLSALTTFPEWPDNGPANVAGVFQDTQLWLAGLVAFLYIPVELAVTTWASTNLTGLGYNPSQARWLLGGFWTAFFLGRLAAALFILLAVRIGWGEPWLVVGLGLCVAIALGNLVGASRPSARTSTLLLLGFFCGPIYPTLLGMIVTRFRQDPGTAVGTLAALGSLGTLALVPLIASNAGQTTQRALRGPLLVSLLLAAAALVLGLTS